MVATFFFEDDFLASLTEFFEILIQYLQNWNSD
jgi:hypothetical protein